MRDLDAGAVLSRVFSIYGSQFATLFGAALVLNLVSVLVSVVATGTSGQAIALIVSFVVGGLYGGFVVKLVQDLEDGRRDSSAGELLSAVTPVLGPLLIVSLLYGVAVGIGLVLLIVPGLFLLTIWAVVAPVVVVERPGVGATFSRSQELVKGHGWQVFGVILVTVLLSVAVTLVISVLAAGIGPGVGLVVLSWIGSSLIAPVTGLVSAVLYFSLRPQGFSRPEPPAGLGGLT